MSQGVLYFYLDTTGDINDQPIGSGALHEVSSSVHVSIPFSGVFNGINFDNMTSWVVFRSNLPQGTIVGEYTANFRGGLFTNGTTSYKIFLGGNHIPSTNGTGDSLLYGLVPVSAICFIAGSMVGTDQGDIKIEEINVSLHTISGEKIKGLVESTGDMPCLAYIKQDLISLGVPERDTFCSVWHKILFNGEMMEAQVLPGAQPYPYSKQTLYNILMEKHSTMKVNNMIVETLHPESSAAKMFLFTNP